MATTRTSNAGLQVPAAGDRGWDAPLATSLGLLDATNAVGGLAVTPAAVTALMAPSGLNVRVAPGSFRARDGSVVAVAAEPSVPVTPSATTYLWLDNVGAVQVGSAWPSADHVKLASVAAGSTNITSVTDERVILALSGATTPTIAGSRGGNAALASLLTQGALLGLWIDGTSA